MAITLASTGNCQGVIVTADTMDSSRVLGGNVRYFAGPLGSASGSALQMVEYASLALAQASAFQIPVDGRVDFPVPLRARFVRLYHRSTDASNHVLREYLPRRLIQSDDIEAETIRAINIAAHTITADQIATINLDATATITAAAGAIVLNDQGITINNGLIKLYDLGMQMQVTPAVTSSAIFWTSTATVSDIAAFDVTTADLGGSTYNAQLTVRAGNTATAYKLGSITLQTYSDTKAAAVIITASESSGRTVEVQADGLYVTSGGLNVGTATGATSGQIAASGNVSAGANISSAVRLFVKGVDTGTSNYAFNLQDSAGTNLIIVRNDGAVTISKSGGTIGFYGTGPAAKPTVSGSRATDAWRTSLMSALSTLGLVVDSSTA